MDAAVGRRRCAIGRILGYQATYVPVGGDDGRGGRRMRLTLRERVYVALAVLGLLLLAAVGSVGRWVGLLEPLRQ